MRMNLGRCILFLAASMLMAVEAIGQASLTGMVSSDDKALGFSATVFIEGSAFGGATNELGMYEIRGIPAGTYSVVVSAVGYVRAQKHVTLPASGAVVVDFNLEEDLELLGEVVVSGTMKAVNKLESTVPVEVYTPRFFKANPTPSV